MNFIVDQISEITNYFSNDPIKVDIFFKTIGTIVSFLPFLWSIICFIDNKIVQKSKSEKNQAKRTLKEYNRHISAVLRNESVFFSEDDPKKLLFYKSVPLKKYHSRKKAYLIKMKMSSYILLGEAGSGKSSIIKNDYLFHSNKFLNFLRIRTGYVYINQQFLNQKITGIDSLDDLIDCIRRTKYKKIYLFIDGIDEFGESKFDQIFKSFIPISNQIRKVKITSRTNFAVQNIINHNHERPFSFKESQRYLVDNWQEKHLIKLAILLLKNLKNKKEEQKNIANIIIQDSCEWKVYIDSPLMMKLYLYILIYGDQNKKIVLDNQYMFYTQFITEIISTQRKRQGNYKIAQIQTELKSISGVVFDAFSNDNKYIQHSENISAILKPTSEGSSYFVHETFFEYFVATNYMFQLTKGYIDGESIAVLQQTYTNSFADFITSALNSLDANTSKQIIGVFFSIYFYTFDKNVGDKYLSEFALGSSGICFLSQISNIVQQLSEREFFTLKYEIIFRLGRIDNCATEIVDFLNFVYNNDENVIVKETPEYYIAVLKRCCAISCSFLGSEQIELDYVKKMIPQNKFGKNNNYIPNYDLANRSHTLFFYGDVIKTSIFDFKDEATNNPFSLAFSKRIERLKYDLPDNVAMMNKKQKKKYYFRVFDLATIYTFMFNRQRVLSNKELEIITKAKVHFIGASDERNDFMREMVVLIKHLNEKIKRGVNYLIETNSNNKF